MPVLYSAYRLTRLRGCVNLSRADPNATTNAAVKEVFVQHAAAAKATQAPDGRWHQLLNDTESFLETSVRAWLAPTPPAKLVSGNSRLTLQSTC